MIAKTVGYKASDGVVYGTLEEAQKAELGDLFAEHGHPLIQQIMEKRDKVLDILTTGPRSRPKARKTPGTTAPKRAASKATAREKVVTEFNRVAKEAANQKFREIHEAVDQPQTESVSTGSD